MSNRLHRIASVRTVAPLIGILGLFAGLSASASEGVDAHGLIEDNCTSCHGSEMYTREDRKVNSLSALKAQVKACDSNLNTGMSSEQLEAVALLLNEEYYKFSE